MSWNPLHYKPLSLQALTFVEVTSASPSCCLNLFCCSYLWLMLGPGQVSSLVFFPFSLLSRYLQVWSLEQPDWHCKIDEGSIGLVSSRWSPDGRHILNTTEFHVSVESPSVYVCVFYNCMYVCLSVCLVSTVAGPQGRRPENSQTPEPSSTPTSQMCQAQYHSTAF